MGEWKSRDLGPKGLTSTLIELREEKLINCFVFFNYVQGEQKYKQRSWQRKFFIYAWSVTLLWKELIMERTQLTLSDDNV